MLETCVSTFPDFQRQMEELFYKNISESL